MTTTAVVSPASRPLRRRAAFVWVFLLVATFGFPCGRLRSDSPARREAEEKPSYDGTSKEFRDKSKDLRTGVRVRLTGLVRLLRAARESDRLFGDITIGHGIVGFGEDGEDALQAVCVFTLGVPDQLEVGSQVTLEGVYRGLKPTSRVPILTGCRVVRP